MRTLRFLVLFAALVGTSAGPTLPAAAAPLPPDVVAPTSVGFGQLPARVQKKQAAPLPAPESPAPADAALHQCDCECHQRRAPHPSLTGFRLPLPGRVSHCLTSPFLPPAVHALMQRPAENL